VLLRDVNAEKRSRRETFRTFLAQVTVQRSLVAVQLRLAFVEHATLETRFIRLVNHGFVLYQLDDAVELAAARRTLADAGRRLEATSLPMPIVAHHVHPQVTCSFETRPAHRATEITPLAMCYAHVRHQLTVGLEAAPAVAAGAGSGEPRWWD